MSVIDEIAAERRRQIEDEGCTAEHDDDHDAGDLCAAAFCYALAAADMLNPHTQGDGVNREAPPEDWPWGAAWWKPGAEPRRALIKAAALIVAEIERIDRKTVLRIARAKGGG